MRSMEKEKIKVVLVDRSNLLMEGIKLILESDQSICVQATDNGEGNIQLLLKAHKPHVLIIEKEIIVRHKINIAKDLAGKRAQLKLAVLYEGEEGDELIRGLKEGVCGGLLKEMSGQCLIDAVKVLYAGQYYIHPKLSDYLVREMIK